MVFSGGDSDYSPIILEIDSMLEKKPNPFKLNLDWLEENSFQDMIKDCWKPFDPSSQESPPLQFQSNLKRVKSTAISWSKEKKREMTDF